MSNRDSQYIFSRVRIRPGLRLLPAAGLVIIMIGTMVVTLAGGNVVMALILLVVGILAAFVAYSRRHLAPFTKPKKPANPCQTCLSLLTHQAFLQRTAHI